MYAGALVHVRIRRVIFGCPDARGAGAGSIMNLLQMPALNHRCEITSGLLQDECAAILQDFFSPKTLARSWLAAKRRTRNSDGPGVPNSAAGVSEPGVADAPAYLERFARRTTSTLATAATT